MSNLQKILNEFRLNSLTEREKGTYFELLTLQYLKNETIYKDLYSNVWTYSDWAELQGLPKNDAGIDLVAKTRGTDEFHAIQCKFYAENYKIQKIDIDSFFTASGKNYFTHRLIVATTNNWSQNAEDAIKDQNPPVSKIDLNDLENSQIDWSQFHPNKEPVLRPKKTLLPHQKDALNAVISGLSCTDRGKLIMACGTGKTYTSLKIAEQIAGISKRVLFLVPSLSLLSQTLTEWTQEAIMPLHSFAVCSDSDVGKKRKNKDDLLQTVTHELRYPATTEPSRLAIEMKKRHDGDHMSVVFSTYHSIDVISRAQKEFALPDFDLVVCDEAHRTTGATFDDADESHFVKIHDQNFIKSKKRLYMTATPRIYGDVAKVSAEKDNVTLCSMDDENLYGKELFVINFSEAVRLDLLVDYKVIVLAVEEMHINRRLQTLLADENNQLRVDDAAKIIGCWKALSKQDTQEDLITDPEPMKRAVAFCQVIEPNDQRKSKTHKVSSKNIANVFSEVVEAYKKQELNENPNYSEETASIKLNCEAEHIDGGMNAGQKEEKLNWLKAEPDENTCRILSNVRCLSEGVDVPALDAVLFLTPRNSQVDVVQSVGRVMRKAQNKKRGYVVLPVVIPAGVEPHEALNDNKTYKVVWQVLQALRSHDDRFDAMINKLDLIGRDSSKMEVIAITEKITSKQKKRSSEEESKNKKLTLGRQTIGNEITPVPQQVDLQFEIGEIERAIYAKVVQKCGNRSHWEDWAKDVANIAKTHISRIKSILEYPENTSEIKAFYDFANEIRDDLNNAISDEEVVEMLAQHLITKPVFDALFEGYSFASKNPMSLAMQEVLEILQEHHIDKELDTLQKFYDSVKMRAEGINSASGKQKIVLELYDKFFRTAFPKMAERLGIVYTPVEAVDFIIQSVNDVLKDEFGQELGHENVHIIDPFTGTGTFITRLLQSGLIPQEKLTYKFRNEIHANEIVLLAYYIAAINIESTYHDLMSENDRSKYEPFKGICLTDSFQLYEKDDLISELLVDNSARRVRQKSLDLRVIIGNPPYSAGQESADDDNANISYLNLDKRIAETYTKNSLAKGGKRSAYDSYIRAIRWASDRIKDNGVIGFVINSGWIDSSSADGLRKCLVDEFSKLYVFNLRGAIRGKSGIHAKKEGQNIFDIMTGVAILILVKNANEAKNCELNYYDIGDQLNRADKLEKINLLKSINGIRKINGWKKIVPDTFNDWLRQRDMSFDNFISIGNKQGERNDTIFNLNSLGIVTGRDEWVFNFSKKTITQKLNEMINFFNDEVDRYKNFCKETSSKPDVKTFVKKDKTKISWGGRSWRSSFGRFEKHVFNPDELGVSLYRPFTKIWHYKSKKFNHSFYSIPSIFPSSNYENLAICLTMGSSKGFSVLMTDSPPDLHLIGDAQCFPFYFYDSIQSESRSDLFSRDENYSELTRQDGITNNALAHFNKNYPSALITKEDIFYYIYGLLHSEEYRQKFADNLSKQLPRIPCVKKIEDFWAFSKAGCSLSKLHVNYEAVKPYSVDFNIGNAAVKRLKDSDFKVTKMKFSNKADKSVVVYNHIITMTNIPLEAYEYEINGKSALEWVMERQTNVTHKESGIVNDANDWAIEKMGNAKYPLELFQRIITVSLETREIINSLPSLDI